VIAHATVARSIRPASNLSIGEFSRKYRLVPTATIDGPARFFCILPQPHPMSNAYGCGTMARSLAHPPLAAD
jgi:hypothetical protein